MPVRPPAIRPLPTPSAQIHPKAEHPNTRNRTSSRQIRLLCSLPASRNPTDRKHTPAPLAPAHRWASKLERDPVFPDCSLLPHPPARSRANGSSTTRLFFSAAGSFGQLPDGSGQGSSGTTSILIARKIERVRQSPTIFHTDFCCFQMQKFPKSPNMGKIPSRAEIPENLI